MATTPKRWVTITAVGAVAGCVFGFFPGPTLTNVFWGTIVGGVVAWIATELMEGDGE